MSKTKRVTGIEHHKVVSSAEWLAARKQLLEKEKAFTRLRDRLSQQRRDLPWERIEKDYIFDGNGGKETLAELFEGRNQLVVYHFMFDPTWDEGCPACSFWADNFNGLAVHLNQRDVTMLAISRAPLRKLQAFKKRMKWGFKWVSSLNTDFNYDFGVSFLPKDWKKGPVIHNYAPEKISSGERAGISVFYKGGDGAIFHTYTCYARGLDMMNNVYHYLDLTPKGRDEDNLEFTMAWVRYHDKYNDPSYTCW
jgi:predicted dithiol-disulfide oxidoreductase (DUF899 family)